MTEYIIDITIADIYDGDSHHHHNTTFYIKIDTNGNVDIKKNYTFIQQGITPRVGEIGDWVIINDNIPIPSYLINMIKNSFCKPNRQGLISKLPGNVGYDNTIRLNHYENAIENIIILKEELAKCQSTLIDLL
jgi:hypothetical protein